MRVETKNSPCSREHFGYSEPLRRFIQRESFEPQANEIPNAMPSWLPGDDYMTNFKVGDPYVKVDDGYARLPGSGYEALHPELQGLNPECRLFHFLYKKGWGNAFPHPSLDTYGAN